MEDVWFGDLGLNLKSITPAVWSWKNCILNGFIIIIMLQFLFLKEIGKIMNASLLHNPLPLSLNDKGQVSFRRHQMSWGSWLYGQSFRDVLLPIHNTRVTSGKVENKLLLFRGHTSKPSLTACKPHSLRSCNVSAASEFCVAEQGNNLFVVL